MGNNEISNAKMELFQTEIRCLQIAKMQDFAPNTPELLGALSGPQTPVRNESNPPPQSFLATGMLCKCASKKMILFHVKLKKRRCFDQDKY